jgi:hypothetical protein
MWFLTKRKTAQSSVLNASSILTEQEFQSILNRELSHMARTKLPLSVVIISLNSDEPQHNSLTKKTAIIAHALANIAVRSIRCTDILGQYQDNRLGLILRDTTGHDAWCLINRIKKLLLETVEEGLTTRDISFYVYSGLPDEVNDSLISRESIPRR